MKDRFYYQLRSPPNQNSVCASEATCNGIWSDAEQKDSAFQECLGKFDKRTQQLLVLRAVFGVLQGATRMS